MVLLDLNFTSYIPTTVLGLLGLLFAYLYGYYRNRDNNKLDQLKAIRASDRSKVMEMLLNDLGVQIDTSSLNSKQKFELVVKLLSAKTRKYLIISITLIILSLIIAFLIWSNYHLSTTNNQKSTTDTSSNQSPSPKMIHDTIIQFSPEDKPNDSLVSRSTFDKKIKASQEVTPKKVAKKAFEAPVHNVNTSTIFLYSDDISTSELWIDGYFKSNIDFRKGRQKIEGLSNQTHLIQFRNFVPVIWTDEQQEHSVKAWNDRNTYIHVDGEASYDVYLEHKQTDSRLDYKTMYYAKMKLR
jgi:hypothetical protein